MLALCRPLSGELALSAKLCVMELTLPPAMLPLPPAHLDTVENWWGLEDSGPNPAPPLTRCLMLDKRLTISLSLSSFIKRVRIIPTYEITDIICLTHRQFINVLFLSHSLASLQLLERSSQESRLCGSNSNTNCKESFSPAPPSPSPLEPDS